MLNDMLIKVLVHAQTAVGSVKSESGQGALEYIAMVVAMVTLIYLGFKAAGVDIMDEASNLVQKVLSGETPS